MRKKVSDLEFDFGFDSDEEVFKNNISNGKANIRVTVK